MATADGSPWVAAGVSSQPMIWCNPKSQPSHWSPAGGTHGNSLLVAEPGDVTSSLVTAYFVGSAGCDLVEPAGIDNVFLVV